MITRFASISSRLAVVSAMLFALAACGGGGGGSSNGNGGGFIDNGGSDVSSTYKLKPVITDVNGNETNTVTAATPSYLTVKVTKRGSGNPASGVLVEAETLSGGAVAQILPASGTATSDSNGEAHFQLAVGEGRGGDTVLLLADATALIPSEGSISFQVGQTGLRIGHFANGEFIEGAIGVSDSELSTGGSAALRMDVVDENGDLAATPDRVYLKSGCTLSGLSNMADSVEVSNGRASASYTNLGCSGEDTITASLESNGAAATGVIYMAPPEADVIQFVSANPRVIALKGTATNGRPETSTVVFGVYAGTQTIPDPNDPNQAPGTPLSGIRVNFSLSTDVGGVSLQSTTGTTSSDGTVSTVIKSGNVATTVRVIATIDTPDGSSVFTSSAAIAVSTGLADQNSISLSSSVLNVRGGLDFDGEVACLTVRMADKFNNPVVDGTQALFTTEYGVVDDVCTTGEAQGKLYLDYCSGENGFVAAPNGGECSVAWVSQNPREPGLRENQDLVRDIVNGYVKCADERGLNGHNLTTGPCPVDLGGVRGLRTTIMVTAEGEEYFVDANGNGLYDQNEDFTNLPEAFVDHNEDRVYTPKLGPNCPPNPNDVDLSRCAAAGSEETFTDFNNDGTYNRNLEPNGEGQYNGSLCPEEGDGIWCSRELVNVRDDIVLIMSSFENFDIALMNSNRIVNTAQEGTSNYAIIADYYNNRPADEISVGIAVTAPCTLLSPSSFNIADSNAYGALKVPVTIGGDGSGDRGTLTVSLEDAGGEFYAETFACQTIFVDPNSPGVSPN